MRIIKRELLIAAIIIVATLTLIYPITYVIGARTLGPFGDGGTMGSFIRSLFAALGEGNTAIWFFTLSPLLVVSVLRLGWKGFRRL